MRSRKGGWRGKPKKRMNRYDPNNPQWGAVHTPQVFFDNMMKEISVSMKALHPTVQVKQLGGTA